MLARASIVGDRVAGTKPRAVERLPTCPAPLVQVRKRALTSGNEVRGQTRKPLGALADRGAATEIRSAWRWRAIASSCTRHGVHHAYESFFSIHFILRRR